MFLTECQDNSRESKEYWDKRLAEKWHLPYHGMFLDSEETIDRMDCVNLEIMTEHMFQFGAKEARILDVACGSGRYAPKLYKNFGDRIRRYVGIDFGSKNIEEAKRLYGFNDGISTHGCEEFYEMDMIDVDKIQPHKFHMIFMVSALSSIERNYRKILEVLKSMLVKEGRLFIFEQDFYMVHWKNE